MTYFAWPNKVSDLQWKKSIWCETSQQEGLIVALSKCVDFQLSFLKMHVCLYEEILGLISLKQNCMTRCCEGILKMIFWLIF